MTIAEREAQIIRMKEASFASALDEQLEKHLRERVIAAVQTTIEAAQALADDGIEAEVIDPRTLVPFDKETVVESVQKTGRLVIVHEAVRRAGFGAEIAAAVIDSPAFKYLQAPIVRVANPGVPVPTSRPLQKYALPDEAGIIAAVRRVMDYA